MSEKEKNYFVELAKIDVSNYIERKGQFNYLSWAYAVDQLRRYDPEATWEVKKFTNEKGVLMPYMQTPAGAFVEVAVTCKGITLSQIHPVLDYQNKPIQNPNAFDVNKAIQRCLVKAIALHGLGLYIYAGEDLPNDVITHQQLQTIEEKAEELAKLRGGTVDKVYAALGIASINHLTTGQADIVIDKLTAWVNKAREEANKAKEETKAAEGA